MWKCYVDYSFFNTVYCICTYALCTDLCNFSPVMNTESIMLLYTRTYVSYPVKSILIIWNCFIAGNVESNMLKIINTKFLFVWYFLGIKNTLSLKWTMKLLFCAVFRIQIRIGSGSRRAKMTHKNRKKRNFMLWSAGCFLLRRAEGFSFVIKTLDPDRYSGKMLDLDLHSMIPDPKHCSCAFDIRYYTVHFDHCSGLCYFFPTMYTEFIKLQSDRQLICCWKFSFTLDNCPKSKKINILSRRNKASINSLVFAQILTHYIFPAWFSSIFSRSN